MHEIDFEVLLQLQETDLRDMGVHEATARARLMQAMPIHCLYTPDTMIEGTCREGERRASEGRRACEAWGCTRQRRAGAADAGDLRTLSSRRTNRATSYSHAPIATQASCTLRNRPCAHAIGALSSRASGTALAHRPSAHFLLEPPEPPLRSGHRRTFFSSLRNRPRAQAIGALSSRAS